MIGIHNIQVNTASLANGHSIAAYLTDAAGALITSTLVGVKQRLDSYDVSSHLDGSAYAATVDYLTSMGAVDESGNWEPLNINAAGELLVSASVTFTAEHLEDAPAGDGFSGIATLLVRQDTLAVSTSTDGDFGAFKSNNLGELYVHDTSALAELVLIKGDTATIVTNTGNTATSVATIATATHLEDAASASGDVGIFALGVRRDTTGAQTSTNGDYSEIQTWSNGESKVVDITNSTLLQQQVSVTSTASQIPATSLTNRKYLLLQNTSSVKMYIGSATVTTTGATAGIELPANADLELKAGPAAAIFAIKSGAGSATMNILEMS